MGECVFCSAGPCSGDCKRYHAPCPTREEFRAQFIIAAIRAGEPHRYIHSIAKSMDEAEKYVFGS